MMCLVLAFTINQALHPNPHCCAESAWLSKEDWEQITLILQQQPNKEVNDQWIFEQDRDCSEEDCMYEPFLQLSLEFNSAVWRNEGITDWS